MPGRCLVCNLRLVGDVCECYPDVRQFCFARRAGAIKELINVYKFRSARCVSDVLAELMAEILPKNCVIVPLPTIGRHVRERGFDHIALLAKKIAKLNGGEVEELLERATDTVQVGTDSETRKKQAAKAYRFRGSADPNVRYLLLDDV